ncbi:unnamed protein product [Rangifer tarandus platyrhynchus]|uniref:Uncharacterized protein n=1 Tax=Rangifer tarandus platyrhynchus TaxID=3082113 RepID=A0AC59YRY0_RANTA
MPLGFSTHKAATPQRGTSPRDQATRYWTSASPQPGAAARIRAGGRREAWDPANLLGPRVAGQERPQHPRRSSLLPRAGQARGSALPAPPGMA